MAVRGRWQLHPIHLYLVRTYLKLDDLQLPLEGPSYGREISQVGELMHREKPTMESLGILVDDEIEPALARALRVLAKPYLWLSSIWFPTLDDDAMWRTIAAITEGNRIILGVQTPGETTRYGGTLTVEIHENATFAETLLPTLPPAPPGNRGAARVPASSFRRDNAEEENAPDSMMQSFRPAHGGSGDRQLALYQAIGDSEHVRGGQFFASMRDRNARVHRSPTLSWFDNAEPDGRYLDHNERGNTGEQVYSLTPADARTIGINLEQLIASVR